MRGHASLEELPQRLAKLRIDLSQEVTKANALLGKVHATADDQARKMEELDQLRNALSPEYIQRFKNDLEVKKINSDIQDIDWRINRINTDLIALLGNADALVVEVSRAALLNDLKDVIVKGINATLNHYYSILAKDVFEMKEELQAKMMRLINEVVEKEFKITDRLIQFSNTQQNEKSSQPELCFTKVVDKIPLSDFIYFNKKNGIADLIVWKTENNPELLANALRDQLLSNGEKVSDYLSYEKWITWGGYYYLIPRPALSALIKKMSECVEAVNKLEAEKPEKSAATEKDLLEIHSAIALYEVKIKRIANSLEEAHKEYKKNEFELVKLDKDLNMAAEKIEKLAEESETFNRLLMERKSVLEKAIAVELSDFKAYEENAAEIAAKNKLVQAQREKVRAAKLAANESIDCLCVFSEEKGNETYRGSEMYLKIKARYDNVVCTYEQILTNMGKCLDNGNTKKLCPQFEENQQRAKELAESKDLKDMYDSLKNAEAECKRIADLTRDWDQKNKGLIDIYKKIHEHTPLLYLQKTLFTTQQAAIECKEFKSSFDGECTVVSKLLNTLESKISTFEKSKNYSGFRGHLTYLHYRLAGIKPEVSGDILPIERKNLEQKVIAKEEELLNQLLEILKIVFSDENIPFWNKQVSIPGGIRAYMDGARLKYSSIGASPVWLAVPRGIYGARIELDKLDNYLSNKTEIVKNVCLKIKARLDEYVVYGRQKPTTELYPMISNFLEDGKLVVTETKLDYLRFVIEQEMFENLQGIKAQNMQQAKKFLPQ